MYPVVQTDRDRHDDTIVWRPQRGVPRVVAAQCALVPFPRPRCRWVAAQRLMPTLRIVTGAGRPQTDDRRAGRLVMVHIALRRGDGPSPPLDHAGVQCPSPPVHGSTSLPPPRGSCSRDRSTAPPEHGGKARVGLLPTPAPRPPRHTRAPAGWTPPMTPRPG